MNRKVDGQGIPGATGQISKKIKPIFQSGRDITSEEINEIREMVKMFPSLPRSELAFTICENMKWLTASGGYKTDACLKLMEKLEAKGYIRLPEKRQKSQKKRSGKDMAFNGKTDPRPQITGSLKEIGSVKIKLVEDKKSIGLWNEYVARYHYLGYQKPFGYTLRYFIVSERDILGCMLLAGAAKALTARDRWIGWNEKQRLSNLAWVVNNSRFLIFPWLQIRNLASHVLGNITRRVRDDWETRWGYRPVLMETFVDPRYYQGSCYKAANWEYLGMTTGEGLVRKGKTYVTTPKMIFVNPLVKDFRDILCSGRLKGKNDEETK